MFLSNPNRINLSKLDKSVGLNGANKPLDVLVVQRLLNACRVKYSGKVTVVADGLCGRKTCEQIKLFQKEVLKFSRPDGLIHPNKNTHQRLLSCINTDFVGKENSAATFYQKVKIDIDRFLLLYGQQFPSESNSAALKKLTNRIFADTDLTDIRWVAYMLATVKRECGIKMQPVNEIGKGRGKDYGDAVKVKDPVSGKEKENVYYGRGFVQITWEYNYKKVGKEIGIGDELFIDPDKALEFEIAYKIMSKGMRDGLFTGARLMQYISGTTCDYISSRRIINGSDHAQEIAKNAVIFEEFLMAARLKNVYRAITGNEYANYV
ncbi:glycoside hydrolase family 19 protein [Cellvibrio sp. QJXJ]|uniref:glycoside hydrolase family 19 protein n=1 Tax=Cellvibrio sp. QJXJ TaxID=2964606 RepID=UPI0021C3E192|nr:glycoside hydrolase family 19 protein [Cellvibrio sp. QJXJ]UUA74566.1 hypothetical protein NNX04_09010 [Cellvibrio sp. QJXJ]